MTNDDGITVEREYRGHDVHVVHLYGNVEFTPELEKRLNRRLVSEGQKWAKESGATTNGVVHSSGQYGKNWRHSGSFIFRKA